MQTAVLLVAALALAPVAAAPTAPSVTISEPAEGAVVAGTLGVAGTITLASGGWIENVEVRIQGANAWQTDGSFGTVGGGFWLYDAEFDTRPARNAEYSILVTATDSFGGIGTASRNVRFANPIDLAVTDITVKPPAAFGTNVEVRVANLQPTPAGVAHVRLEILYKGAWKTLAEREDFFSADDKDTYSFVVPTGLTKVGTFQIRATIDVYGVVAEADESNNVRSAEVALVTAAVKGQDLRDPTLT